MIVSASRNAPLQPDVEISSPSNLFFISGPCPPVRRQGPRDGPPDTPSLHASTTPQRNTVKRLRQETPKKLPPLWTPNRDPTPPSPVLSIPECPYHGARDSQRHILYRQQPRAPGECHFSKLFTRAPDPGPVCTGSLQCHRHYIPNNGGRTQEPARACYPA